MLETGSLRLETGSGVGDGPRRWMRRPRVEPSPQEAAAARVEAGPDAEAVVAHSRRASSREPRPQEAEAGGTRPGG